VAILRRSGGTGLLVFSLACVLPPVTGQVARDSSVIASDEIGALSAANAYEVIQKLRPNFLSYRGETSLNKSESSPYPTVYVDGMAFGTIATLRTIPAMQIASIRLYRSWEAATRFGMGNMGGVLEITTRR
ncbi:MAG TPA: hypothetical protein VM939_00855, partial [Gemmatimonadaceae bacterium]|nr:hypothetical protein [Gemmatimonadaceae bacterium]